jgi:hypothetical protein
MAKLSAYERILSLDPDKDHWEIIRLSVYYEFPWDYARALELALFRTFAVPSISSILDRSQEFGKRPQKRYDDTDLILSEILENGPESERAKAAIKKLNFIHSHFNISNQDYLYVLSTFIFEPEKWVNKYGYRQISKQELNAGYKVWQELGALMGIKNIPATRDKLRSFSTEYEATYFIPQASNHAVALSTENLFLARFLPKSLYSLGRPFLHAVMDEPLLKAVGFNKPRPFIQAMVDGLFAFRKAILKIWPRSTKAVLRTQLPRKQSYPKGYEVSQLGSMPYHQAEKQDTNYKQ